MYYPDVYHVTLYILVYLFSDTELYTIICYITFDPFSCSLLLLSIVGFVLCTKNMNKKIFGGYYMLLICSIQRENNQGMVKIALCSLNSLQVLMLLCLK